MSLIPFRTRETRRASFGEVQRSLNVVCVLGAYGAASATVVSCMVHQLHLCVRVTAEGSQSMISGHAALRVLWS